jgi:hypothetical protein
MGILINPTGSWECGKGSSWKGAERVTESVADPLNLIWAMPAEGYVVWCQRGTILKTDLITTIRK